IPEVTGEYWINQLQLERNAKALKDRSLESIRDYIKNKTGEVSNQVLIDLDMADNLVKKDELERALKIYKKILEKDQNFMPAIEGCADRLYNLKRYDESYEYLKKLYNLNPFSSKTFLLAAHCLVNTKKYDKAKEMIEYALLIRDDKSFYYLLQQCYNNLGNKNTAELIRRKMSLTAENINLVEVEEFLIHLYNKNVFYRKLFVFGYKLLKMLSRK
ncbi:MAG: hypothetical protein IH843_05655, partial [Thaumarchaeota archaeon]|nr:hypothetical protein [Nitrososphaerota archaeon]